MRQFSRTLTVEVRGRVLGEYDLIETLERVSSIAMDQRVPAGLFTAEVTMETGSRSFNNVSGCKIGTPELTEYGIAFGGCILLLSLSPPRDIGVYQGRPVGRVRRTVYFYG